MTAYNPDACNLLNCCDNRTLVTPVAAYVVNNIAALRAMSTAKVQLNETAQTLGASVIGDGGANLFYWSPTETTTDNAGTIIKPADKTTGRWVAISRSVLYAHQFEGANAGYKMAAAITAATATYGSVVDATGLTGAQTITASPFTVPSKPITLILGAGTYTVTGDTDWLSMRTGQKIIGSGIGITIIKVGSMPPGQDSIIATNPSSTDNEIAHLTIDGSDGLTHLQSAIVAYSGSNRINLHDLYIKNVYCTLATILIRDSTYAKLSNISIDTDISVAAGHGVQLYNASPTNNYHQLENISVNGGGMAYHLMQSNRNQIVNCEATATAFASFEGFNLDSSNDNTFVNISAWGRGDAGYIETYNENFAGSPPCARNKIIGGVFGGNKNDGVSIGCTDGTYENITTFNNGQGGGGGPARGIIVNNGCTNATLRNIFAFDNQGGSATQRVGVYVNSAASNTTLDGIKHYGNPDGGIQNFSTSTLYNEETWTAPSLLNSWINYGPPNQTAGYRKNLRGVVEIKGLIKNGTTTAGTTFFVLPATYRPLEDMYFTVGGLAASPVVIEVIASNGNVALATTGTSGSLSLSGITFPTI